MDFICELAVQEIAMDGPSGTTLSRLWDLLERRIGDAPRDVVVRQMIWWRLRALDQSGTMTFFKPKQGGDAETDLERVSVREMEFPAAAAIPGMVIKAAMKLRILVLGMEFGFSTDSTSTLEVKKQAFRMLSLVGKARMDGVRQNLLAKMLSVDSVMTNTLLQVAERRNLISKLWADRQNADPKMVGSGQRGFGARVVYMKRLTDRKVWPLFYSGMGFSQGLTNTMKRAQAIRIMRLSAPNFIEALIARKRKISIMDIIRETSTKLLQSIPGMEGLARQLKSVFLKLLIGIIRRRRHELCVVQQAKSKVSGMAVTYKDEVEEGDEVMEGGWVAALYGGDDEEKETGLTSDDFRLNVNPQVPLLSSLLRQIFERSPIGAPRHVLLPYDSKVGEQIVDNVKFLHGLVATGTSIGKQQHVIFFAKKPLADTFKNAAKYYTPARDPTLFPSRAAAYDPKATDAEDTKPTSSTLEKKCVEHLSQTMQLRTNPLAKPRPANERLFLLHGRFPSWAAGVGARGCPSEQWYPSEKPLPPPTAKTREKPDGCPMRAAHWLNVHMDASVKTKKRTVEATPASKRAKTTKNEPAPTATKAKKVQEKDEKDEKDEEEEEEGADEGKDEHAGETFGRIRKRMGREGALKVRGTSNIAVESIKAVVLDKLKECAVLDTHDLTAICAEAKLRTKVTNALKDEGLIVVHERNLDLYMGSAQYNLYALPGVGPDRPEWAAKVQSSETFLISRAYREAPQGRSEWTYLEDVLDKQGIRLDVAKLDPELRADDKALLLYYLHTIPTDVTLMQQFFTVRDRARRADLVKTLGMARQFYEVKNGFITARLQRTRALHNYLVGLTKNGMSDFSVRDITGGMTLETVGELVGIRVDISDLLRGTEWEDKQDLAMQTPVHTFPQKVKECAFPSKLDRKVSKIGEFADQFGTLLRMGLIRIVSSKASEAGPSVESVPQEAECQDDDAVEGDPEKQAQFTNQIFLHRFATVNDISIRSVLNPDAVPLFEEMEDLTLDFSLDGSAYRQQMVEYWSTLRALCISRNDEEFPEHMKVDVLGLHSKYQHTWDGSGVLLGEGKERAVDAFKKRYPLGHMFTSYDCYRLSKLRKASYATSCVALVGHPKFKSSLQIMNRTLGLKKRMKRKRAGSDIDPREEYRKKRTRSKATVDEVNGEEEDEEELDGSDDDDVSDEYDVRDRRGPNWFSREVLLDVYEAIVRSSDATEFVDYSTSSGIVYLKKKHAQRAAKQLGWTTKRLTLRYRYLGKLSEVRRLAHAARILSEYNQRCGRDRHTSLRPFLEEVFNPALEEGKPLSPIIEDVTERYQLVGYNPVDKTDEGALDLVTDTPKVLANIEALKMVHLSAEEDYDKDLSRAVLQDFAEDGKGTLMKVMPRFIGRGRSQNMLCKSRTQRGRSQLRAYHFSTKLDSSVLPLNLGLNHYRDLSSLAHHVKSQSVYRPHELLTGGQLGHILHEFSAGRLSLVPQSTSVMSLDFTTHKKLTVAKMFTVFFDKATRGARRQPIHYVPDGVDCVPVTPRMDDTLPRSIVEREPVDDPADVLPPPVYINLWRRPGAPQQGRRRGAGDSYRALEAEDAWSAGFNPETHAAVEAAVMGHVARQPNPETCGYPAELLEGIDAVIVALPQKRSRDEFEADEDGDVGAGAGKRTASEVEESDPNAFADLCRESVADALRLLPGMVNDKWLQSDWSATLPRTVMQVLNDVGMLRVHLEALQADRIATAFTEEDLNTLRIVTTAAAALLRKAAASTNKSGDPIGTTEPRAIGLVRTMLRAAVRDAAPAEGASPRAFKVYGHALCAAVCRVALAALTSVGILKRIPHFDDPVYMPFATAQACLCPDMGTVAGTLERRRKDAALGALDLRRRRADGKAVKVDASSAPAPLPQADKESPGVMPPGGLPGRDSPKEPSVPPLPGPEELQDITGAGDGDAAESGPASPAGDLTAEQLLEEYAHKAGAVTLPRQRRPKGWAKAGVEAHEGHVLDKPHEQKTDESGRGYRQDFVMGKQTHSESNVQRPLSSLAMLNGSFNASLYNAAVVAFYDYISTHPGITATILHNRMTLYSSADVQRILDSMVARGLLDTMTCPPDVADAPIGLFDSRSEKRVSAYFTVPGSAKDMDIPDTGASIGLPGDAAR